MLVASVRSQFRDVTVTGWLVQPEGDRAVPPPGADRRLAPGEMVASPALAELLSTPDGARLGDRWGGRLVGTIAPAGLVGPLDYTFYQGSDRLTEDTWTTRRIRSFGDATQDPESLSPLLLVLAVVGLVVLLLPVMIFVTTAVRFGSEARDRQLAAIRLVGADAAMTRRVAAGETLVGTLLGLALGGAVFLAIGRLLGDVVPPGLSFFPADVRPVPALVALVVVLVPAAAVMVTLSALRRVVIEPLGVVRHGGERRRRLWWRLVPPAIGLALLYPLLRGITDTGGGTESRVAAGVMLLLIGLVLLLPWFVQASVHRLGGGTPAWQLAVRRLQLDSGTAVRAVSGIAVSVAGVIAVQGLLAAAQVELSVDNPPADRFQATVYTSGFSSVNGAPDPGWPARLAGVPGVRSATGVTLLLASDGGSSPATLLRIAGCDALRQYAKLTACTDGDAFLVGDRLTPAAVRGTVVPLDREGVPPQWTVPAGVRPASPYVDLGGGTVFLVTPAAFGSPVPAAADILVALDPADPDAIERVRNATGQADPFAAVTMFQNRQTVDALAGVQEALFVGAVALLVIIGASMLVNVLEQLRERRRLLAVLVAFGTRRATLSGSVLYQVTIPVVLGLTLAVGTGTGLAALLQSLVDIPIRLDWPGIVGVSGAAAVVVLAVTAASLPLLWRLTRADGLRTE
jgi:hypothetical protein